MMMVLYPVELFGSTPRGADKVNIELDSGNDPVSLTVSLEGSHYGIPYGSFLGDSLEVKTGSMYTLIMGLICTGSL